MKNSVAFLSSCVLLTLISISNFSQSKRQRTTNVNAREIAQIEIYTVTIDSFIKQNKQTAEIYANISSNEKSNWQAFKSEKAREAADTGDNLNENAYVWRKNNNIIAVSFTFQSPSRDWAHFITHYYRTDGSVANVKANLNTFYGNASVEQQFYFDERGKLLRQTKRVLDLQTRKPKKLDEDFIDQEVYIFRKVSKLTFASLLRS